MEAHPSAIIDPGAQIHHSAKIGPFSIIGPHVKIGKDTVIESHGVFSGHVTVGENNYFHPFCSVGAPPQDLGYGGEPTEVMIGHHNVFREYVSIHRGTTKENHQTIIGNYGFFMAHVHFGHDVVVGDHCILANNCQLGGHVRIGNKTVMGGGVAVAQFIQIGTGTYIGGQSGVDRDVLPYVTGYGNHFKIKGPNLIGLKKAKLERQQIKEVMEFFDQLRQCSSLKAQAQLRGDEQNPIIREICEFMLKSKKGIAELM